MITGTRRWKITASFRIFVYTCHKSRYLDTLGMHFQDVSKRQIISKFTKKITHLQRFNAVIEPQKWPWISTTMGQRNIETQIIPFTHMASIPRAF